VSDFEGIPSGIAGVDTSSGSAWILVDEVLYPLDALYGAAYVFIDRCHVFLDRAGPGQVRVTLSPKAAPVDSAVLRSHVGEFANELLSCAWR